VEEPIARSTVCLHPDAPIGSTDVERGFLTIFEHSPDAMLGFDRAGRIRMFNARAEELLGYRGYELLGKSIDRLLQGLDLAQLEDQLAPASPTARWAGLRREQTARRADGTPLYVEMSVTPIPVNSELLIAARIRDVTERAREDQQRQDLLERERAARSSLERINRIKDEFLITLSHELRTPLNSMLGWTQLLASGKLDEPTSARALQTIERNIRLQSQLIDDLLDMSRILSGKMRLEARPTPIAPIVDAALEIVSPAAENRGIRLHKSLDREGIVFADPGRLQQVIWNLLSNAIKFTPGGGEVEVRVQRVDSWLQIVVRDTGQGIDPGFLPHVFDRFRQDDGSTTRAHGGMGLGLSLVRSLVEMHGGLVRAESDGLDKGSTFTISLPISGVLEPALAEQTAATRPGAALSRAVTPVGEQRLDGLRVLVVDDEQDAREYVKRLLEGCGAEVVIAGSAPEALRVLARERPAVMVCDIGMPNEDGYELIRKVRLLATDQGGLTPAAAVTAYSREEDQRKSLELGFQFHLSKPVEPAHLIGVVAELAKGRTQGGVL
jgi:PAS domain S-box-containing protein